MGMENPAQDNGKISGKKPEKDYAHLNDGFSEDRFCVKDDLFLPEGIIEEAKARLREEKRIMEARARQNNIKAEASVPVLTNEQEERISDIENRTSENEGASSVADMPENLDLP